MLDFFSRSAKKLLDPLKDADSARQWVDGLREKQGAGAHDHVTELVRRFNTSDDSDFNVDTLEALLVLNLETQILHDQLCAQYLMNKRMPKVLETQLRGRILSYSKEISDAYRGFVLAGERQESKAKLYPLFPLALARMMYYACEFARWQFYRHFTPDKSFWLKTNQLFQFAERAKFDSVPVVLFQGDAGGTTMHDQFLILHMLAQLSAGNLSLRQVHFAYELLSNLSNRLVWKHEYSPEASFAVQLDSGHPATRCMAPLQGNAARYWSTAELVEVMIGWLASMEAGKTPSELRDLLEPGVDVALLRMLCREWAPKPVRVERAERVVVSDREIEVAYRFPMLHRLVRYSDKHAQSKGREMGDGNFKDATDIRIYGFVTSRRKDRISELANAAVPEQQLNNDEFPSWSVENISQTGLGVSLHAKGCEWVGLGSLIGYRYQGTDDWSLGLIRRVKRLGNERIFLGIETLSSKPVAASLWQADGRLLDPNPPAELNWQDGLIGLFVPTKRAGHNVNALVLPLASYIPNRQLYMFARGKHFIIALGKVLEKGTDWCLSDVELVKTLEKPPLSGL